MNRRDAHGGHDVKQCASLASDREAGVGQQILPKPWPIDDDCATASPDQLAGRAPRVETIAKIAVNEHIERSPSAPVAAARSL